MSGRPEPISPLTRPGAVHLTVADLGRSVDYYERVVGLRTLVRDPGRAALGTGARELVVLVEEPGARPAGAHTGLFHLALLVPERVDLARWLAHAARDRVRLAGLSDHAVSEAIYLRDPDGHGIEIYVDRPRETWEGRVGELMTTLPLDLDELLATLPGAPGSQPFEGLPEATVMGHVHLRVADVDAAVAFYTEALGLELMTDLGASAAFLAAGGYHHHVGVNSWESRGASPPPPGAAALRHATLVLPSAAERERLVNRVEAAGVTVHVTADGPLVEDPSGNRLSLAIDDGARP